MRKIFHDTGLQDEFERNGYVVVDMIDLATIEKINEAYNSLTPDDSFKPSDGRYHCTFIDTNTEYKKSANRLFKQYFDPLLEKLLIHFEILIGSFYVKQPGCGEFEVHQNWNTLDEKLHTSVTVWIPLQDTNELNGTIEVIAGSNKLVDNINTLHTPGFFYKFEKSVKEKYLKPIDLKKGQAIIFDDNLIHYSKSNRSDAPRKAIQLICVPEEAQLIFYHVDPANEKEIELYETNGAFYLEHDLKDIVGRPPLKQIGRIPNENIYIREKEFARLLKKGEHIRRNFYNGKFISKKRDQGVLNNMKKRMLKLFN